MRTPAFVNFYYTVITTTHVAEFIFWFNFFLIKKKFSLNQDVAISGTFGQIDKLDTHTPVFYIELPEGRAKLIGYRQYINSRLITLECKPNELSCPDQFDNLIVFAEVMWIGKRMLFFFSPLFCRNN